jgi:predicted small secreted protein
LKKILLSAAALALAAALLAGCGGSSTKGAFGGDIMRDKEAIKKAAAEMKAKGGTPLMIFQSVNLDSDFIRFSRQDQKKPANVDEFIWSATGGWQGPSAVRLRGDGKLEDNIYNADIVNWEAVPAFFANVEKTAKEKGMEKIKIDGILVYFNGDVDDLKFSATVKAERNEASAEGSIKTGEVTYFKIR